MGAHRVWHRRDRSLRRFRAERHLLHDRGRQSRRAPHKRNVIALQRAAGHDCFLEQLPGHHNVTYSFWVYLPTITADVRLLTIGKTSNNSGYWWKWGVTAAGYVYCSCQNSATFTGAVNGYSGVTTTLVPQKAWTHFTLFQPVLRTAAVCMNGVLVSTTVSLTSAFTTKHDLYFTGPAGAAYRDVRMYTGITSTTVPVDAATVDLSLSTGDSPRSRSVRTGKGPGSNVIVFNATDRPSLDYRCAYLAIRARSVTTTWATAPQRSPLAYGRARPRAPPCYEDIRYQNHRRRASPSCSSRRPLATSARPVTEPRVASRSTRCRASPPPCRRQPFPSRLDLAALTRMATRASPPWAHLHTPQTPRSARRASHSPIRTRISARARRCTAASSAYPRPILSCRGRCAPTRWTSLSTATTKSRSPRSSSTV
ncbi:hypothetical protein T492DRAFT_976318 [Pavlovales sp. CCMP2436]|nr:hypothetical protein T492DRAFT_976318 [Pavlovales sp. CCMP2436]